VGVSHPTNPKLDDIDLLPYLEGKAERRPHEALFRGMGIQAAGREGRRIPEETAAGLWRPGERQMMVQEGVDVMSASDLFVRCLENESVRNVRWADEAR